MSQLASSNAQYTLGPSKDTASVLRALINKYEFEEGAVLVQIPQVPPTLVDRKVAKNHGYFAYPPQGLFYLSAALRDLNVETKIIDLNYEMLLGANNSTADLNDVWKKELDQKLKLFQLPFVCISFMFDSTFGQLIDVCRYIKERHTDLCVAVGGVAATADPMRILKRGLADLVFANEGELPLAQFYSYLRGKQNTLPPNLAFMNTEDKKFYETPKVTGSKIDWDIRPEFKKLPLDKYNKIGSLTNFSRMRGKQIPYATIISRRGCRARCTFCSVRNFNGKSVRVRDNSEIVSEMLYLRESFGIEHFNWLDDDLLYDRVAALELFRLIEDKLPGISWDANNGLIAAAVTPALLEAMGKSGCIGFTVGLETGNEEILRKIKKPASLKKFHAFTMITRNYPGIFYTVNFILGLPEERFGQALDSFTLALKSKLNWNNFFLFQPLKNTDMHKTYGGMEDNITEEELIRRGTTINYNAARNRISDNSTNEKNIATGYDVFDIGKNIVPTRSQRTEIWFTFNYIVNFLLNPALTTKNESTIQLALKWFTALGQAYEDNPAIDCMLYFLKSRINNTPNIQLETLQLRAKKKFDASGYWQIRDCQFGFEAFLENEIPKIDKRVNGVL